ncbi:MAG TPA: alpha/beta hydrolase domain-containing protein [Rhizomicrobium sp.]|nr:alpha/beta hydrolase domain-containing protein [Rhizomicrobium sp.]
MKTGAFLLACLIATPVVTTSARAAVTRFSIEKASLLAGGYQLLEGHFTGALDVNDRRNATINDLRLAPLDSHGQVAYSATFSIALPTGRMSGVLVYDVPNRGGGGAAKAIGDGHVNVVSGWQGDLEEGPGVQLIHVPSAPLTGPAMVRFMNMPAGTTTMPVKGGPQGKQGGRGFDVASADGARLYTGASDERPTEQKEVPHSDWAFADCSSTPFPGTPDLTKLCVKGGFDPKLAYTLAFAAQNPKVLGIGFAATRDLVAFLRYDTSSANPLAGLMRWAIGRGVSQSGNFLRAFVNLGFNTAENGQIVFDGINPIVAMRMNSMSYRFASPGGLVGLYEIGNEGINWWSDYDDSVRGTGKHGLLDRCLADDRCPKVAEIMGSAEFWNLRASVDYVGTDLKADIPLPANVRRYYNAGVNHNGGRGGFDLVTPPVANCILASNPNPSSDTNRAIFAALVDWVTKGTPPPPSKYPRLAAGQLVSPEAYSKAFPNIPGQPRPAYSPLYQYDLGERFNYPDMMGAISVDPPRIVKTIPQLMPRIDADGNELDGIRSPLLTAPLGSYVGWNIAASGFEQGRYCGNTGGYIPFAATKAERMAKGDPRPSLEERYPSHAAYVAKVKAQANALVAQRYMLPADAARIVAEAEAAKVP